MKTCAPTLLFASLCLTTTMIAQGEGLATKYPLDKGIQKNAAVLFATSFEGGIPKRLKKQRKGVELIEDAERRGCGGVVLDGTHRVPGGALVAQDGLGVRGEDHTGVGEHPVPDAQEKLDGVAAVRGPAGIALWMGDEAHVAGGEAVDPKGLGQGGALVLGGVFGVWG